MIVTPNRKGNLTMTKRTKTRHKYRVSYFVTSKVFYEIEASNPTEAKALAYTEGKWIESGDTTHFEALGVEEIETFGRTERDEAFEALARANR
jgi:hypothetical protein